MKEFLVEIRKYFQLNYNENIAAYQNGGITTTKYNL